MTKKQRSEMREIIAIELGEGKSKIKRTYYTVLGLSKRLPGKKGKNTSPNTIYKYLEEGMPHFNHAGLQLFPIEKLADILNWLEDRKTPKQLEIERRNRRFYAPN